jgi:hypothetical protein
VVGDESHRKTTRIKILILGTEKFVWLPYFQRTFEPCIPAIPKGLAAADLLIGVTL